MSRGEATEARRLMILAVMREAPGAAMTSDIVRRLRQLHGQGLWPAAAWPGARQDPYSVGIYQHLRAMQNRGFVKESADGWGITAKAPATDELPSIAGMAAELLPDEEMFSERLRAYERRFGKAIILGVDFALRRVIRYQTSDGLAEVVVQDGDWNQALTAVGA